MSSIRFVHGGITADGRVLIAGLIQKTADSLDSQSPGDSIDVAFDDRYSELSAILETTEPLSEPDTTTVQKPKENAADMGDADEKTESIDPFPISADVEETRHVLVEEAIPQSAEIDAIAAALTPAENEEVRAEVELIEESAQIPSQESIGSVDIEEILHKEAAEGKEKKEDEECDEQIAEKTVESPQDETSSHPSKNSKEFEQLHEDGNQKQPEKPNRRPELEDLIEQLTEGYDGAQNEADAGSLGQSEAPELPEDAMAEDLGSPPSMEAEEKDVPQIEEPQSSTVTPLVSVQQPALSPIHISPRPGGEGFLEDAPPSESSDHPPTVSNIVDPSLHEESKHEKNAEGLSPVLFPVLFIWSGVNTDGIPLLSGLCVQKANISNEPTGVNQPGSIDKPDQADDGGQRGRIDDSKGDQPPPPPPNDHEAPEAEKPEPPPENEEEQKEDEKQAEPSEKIELVSVTPVESAVRKVHESTAAACPPEPSAASLLVPRSPAPFASIAAEEKSGNADGQLVVDIDAATPATGPIKSEKPTDSAEELTVGDRPLPAAKGEQNERKPRRSVDLPATPLSFHSFSSAAQLYAPVSPPLRHAIGALQAPPTAAEPLKPRSISDSATAAVVELDQASDQTEQEPLRASNEVGRLLSGILTRLRHLQMTDPPKYANIVERLHALESEMSMQNTGVPPDPELTELVGRILASDYPHSDLQIVVSTSRKSTSTTQFYETETPGMVGLAPEQLRELQQKLMNKISGTTDYGTALDSREQPDGLKHRNANEEAWTTGDGNETVTKRSIRQTTTTHSGITGAGDHELKDQLIRLKINRQVYDGQLDPSGHHIRLIPIQQIPVNYY